MFLITTFSSNFLILTIQEDGELFPTDAQGKIRFSDVDYVDTWKAMEELVKKGFTKSIGLSNFNKRQIERILSIASIPPVTNQVRYFYISIYLNHKGVPKV